LLNIERVNELLKQKIKKVYDDIMFVTFNHLPIFGPYFNCCGYIVVAT